MNPSAPLDTLPPEILHQILLYLDYPDLLPLSRTSHLLRNLSLSPTLHRHRRQTARTSLSRALERRVSRASISPPQAWIYLSKTNVLSRSISRSLVRIRVGHWLEGGRPGVEELVGRNLMPGACLGIAEGRDAGRGCIRSTTGRGMLVSPVILRRSEEVRKSRLRDRLGRKLERRPSVWSLVERNLIPEECVGGVVAGTDVEGAQKRVLVRVSPRLVEIRRRVMKETLKDGLRAWVEKKAVVEQRRREESICWDGKVSVKALVRKLTVRGSISDKDGDELVMEKKRAQAKWGREAEIARRKDLRRKAALRDTGDSGGCDQPTRAHVLGLRRFWEGVIKSAVAGP